MGLLARDLGHHQDPRRLRLPPQSLVLCPVGPAAPRTGRRPRQPGDDPPPTPSLPSGLPRPAPGPQARRGGAADQLAELRKVLENLPEDETAVWQDEVDVNTNPKVGWMWMFAGTRRPSRRRGRTRSGTSRVDPLADRPGLRHRGGSQARSQRGLVHQALRRLAASLRRYRKIHVICDNAGSHTSLEVIQYLWKHEGRLEVHLLPAYSPDLNPIERVWWHLHENITRNHRCKDLEELWIGCLPGWNRQIHSRSRVRSTRKRRPLDPISLSGGWFYLERFGFSLAFLPTSGVRGGRSRFFGSVPTLGFQASLGCNMRASCFQPFDRGRWPI